MAKATRYPAAEVADTGRTVRGLAEVAPKMPCVYCGWPIAPEGVTLTGVAAQPPDGARAVQCDDTACVAAASVIFRPQRPAGRGRWV